MYKLSFMFDVDTAWIYMRIYTNKNKVNVYASKKYDVNAIELPLTYFEVLKSQCKSQGFTVIDTHITDLQKIDKMRC